MAAHVDRCHRQRITADVRGVYPCLAVTLGEQNGKAARAGTQIKCVMGLARGGQQQVVVSQQFSDIRARHDHTFIGKKSYPRQPRFMREIGGGLACADACLDQGACTRCAYNADFAFIQRRIRREAQCMQREQGGFVLRGAVPMAKCQRRAAQRARACADQTRECVMRCGQILSSVSWMLEISSLPLVPVDGAPLFSSVAD